MDKTCKISVVGFGKVECDADLLDITLSVYRTDDKSSIAQEQVNNVINKILNELKIIGFKGKDVITTPMGFYEDYEWEKDKKVYKGIQVSQSVKCRIRDLVKNTKKIIKIIDFVGNENEKINFSQRFYLENFNQSLELCREIAYKDALTKAEHYAKLSNTTIKGVNSISEYKNIDYNDRRDYCAIGASESDDDSSTNFSIKKISTDMTLYVDFYAE